jgi:hypothetical protein
MELLLLTYAQSTRLINPLPYSVVVMGKERYFPRGQTGLNANWTRFLESRVWL